MAEGDAVTAGQVEHMTRQEIVSTLLRTGPLTAGGLAGDLERPMSYIRRHLRILRRAGAVGTICARPARGDGVAFSATLDGVPGWAQEALLGEFSLPICMHLMVHLAQSEGLDIQALSERSGLSVADTTRYLLFMEALQLVALAPTTLPDAEPGRPAMQKHPKLARWKLRFRFPGIDPE